MTSHIRVPPPGSISQTVPSNEPRDYDTWQMFDPPSKVRSLNTPAAYRDTELVAVLAEATRAGSTDSTFEVIWGEPDPDDPETLVFTIVMECTFEATMTSELWTPDPPTPVKRGLTRRAINMTQVGSGLRGFAVTYLFR